MSKKQEKIGVVLMNLGGPTSVEGVREFLENLFGDQDIINIGGGKFQKRLAKTIAKYRYKGVSEKYKEINGCPNGCTGSKYCTNRQNKVVSDCCSPINSLTELQRRTLEKKLKAEWPEQSVKVYTAMRYWLPFDYDVIKEIYEDKIDHLVLLPLYPQFSFTTSGSSFRNWEDIRGSQEQPAPWDEYIINNYHLNKNYLASLNDRIDEGLKKNFDESERNKVHIVFTAHGTPLSEIEKGDPYTQHIRETVEGVMNMREQKESYWLSYQSRVGPSKWTQPNTEKLVFRLLDYGVKYILMVPVAFVTDHIETLHELNIELREEIEGRDYKKLAITKGLNDHPLFMQALQDEISLKLGHILPGKPASKEKASVS
ncbi:MAG: ferrochelatase [Balneolales bacterium]